MANSEECSAERRGTLNLRPLLPSNHRILRSAHPSGTPEHVPKLVARVNAVIDLRGEWELARDTQGAPFRACFALREHVDRGEGVAKRRYSCDLQRHVAWAVARSLSPWTLLVCLSLLVTCQLERAKRTAVANSFMNTRNGLGVFYVTIVESHKAEVRRAFEVLAHPGSYPVLIHCSVGKDRTGVVIALIHRLIGTPDAVILADYLTSHGELQPIRASIEWEVSKLGMSPEEFAGCKEEALIQMLDHIDAKYGGVEGYLGAIGVSKNNQDKVRNNILEVK